MDEQLSLPAANSRRVRIGVIGLGHIFRTCHEPALLHLRELGWPFEITALADNDRDTLTAAVKNWPEAKAYEDGKALLEDADIDGVMLLLPTHVMPEYGRLALQRHASVFLEKPVAHDTAILRELIELKDKHNCRALVGYNRRYQQLAEAFKNTYASLAPPTRIEAKLLRDKRKEPHFYQDVLGHPLDFIAATFGKITGISAEVTEPEVDAVLAKKLFITGNAGSLPFTLHIEPASGVFEESYKVIGQTGNVRLDYGSPVTADACLMITPADSPEERITFATKDASQRDMIASQGFTGQIAHWLRLVAGDDETPCCSLHDALNTWKNIETVTQTTSR